MQVMGGGKEGEYAESLPLNHTDSHIVLGAR